MSDTGSALSVRRLLPWAALLLILPLFARCGSGPDGLPVTPTYGLRPMTLEQAVSLARYLRGTRTQAAGSPESFPTAWAMINTCCEERALLMQYAAAGAAFPLPAESPLVKEEDITPETVAALAANPGIDTATINIVGPLIADVGIKDKNGTPLSGDPLPVHWGYHKGVVVNVDGMLMVIDLSVADVPLPIDTWAHNLVDTLVECRLLSDDEYADAWVYWNSVFCGLELPPRPEHDCGYIITPLFTFRNDQEPQVDQLRWTPASMQTQSEGFSFLLQATYGVTPAPEDIPFYTCAYDPRPETELCDRMPDLPACQP
ncbi:MAG: hypothetical protein ACOZBW_12750 [Thermodesulfobacteriota bacterium]